ncbi:hypothetical protein J437_LFUL005541 [Ladona fulva]|uniref:Uncharacterized protein n=1 Tax=Ladona fulva TaxID=123851 RepID=A0A8K0JY96_LADFU|nr:hypothetical protein J437_LFUL005541 [Ladona fulva]
MIWKLEMLLSNLRTPLIFSRSLKLFTPSVTVYQRNFSKKDEIEPTGTEPPIPAYEEKLDEPIETKRARNVHGARPTPVEFDSTVMKMLQEHVKNKNRESRIRQPDLY